MSRINRNRDAPSTFETDAFLERARRIYESRWGGHYMHLQADGTAAETYAAAQGALKARFPKFAAQLSELP